LSLHIILWLLVPFLGSCLGAALAFLMQKDMSLKLRRCLTGFAAGVMVAASIWSLLIPSMQQSSFMGKFSCIPAVAGFWLGILFLLLLDNIIPHFHTSSDEPEGMESKLGKTTMLVLAVTLHNIPEGMAVGVVFSGWLVGNAGVSIMAAISLTIGIAIQNFPEGAIVSLPLQAEGMSKRRAFLMGILSGAVEPVAAALTILAASFVASLLPYLLSFAAGAMMYVVVEELIPEMSVGKHSNFATIAFSIGFTLMMTLDTMLG